MDLKTIRDFIAWGASRFTQAGLFFGHGTANALDEAAALVLHTLQKPYDLPLDQQELMLTDIEQEKVAAIIEQRITGRKPSAYLTHEAIFAGLSFYVDERVLVPRSPIAELIEDAFTPWVEPSRVHRILDLGTGSGCIAIACAYAFPDAQVDAVDCSRDALDVAALNIQKHRFGGRVRLINSDMFSDVADQSYDLIVSNPPYVSRTEWELLPREFHAEPQVGFDGGDSGLDCVQRILSEAAEHLSPSGTLVVEVGSSAETLQRALPDVPFLWLEFDRGGDGVFVLTGEQLAGLFCDRSIVD